MVKLRISISKKTKEKILELRKQAYKDRDFASFQRLSAILSIIGDAPNSTALPVLNISSKFAVRWIKMLSKTISVYSER